VLVPRPTDDGSIDPPLIVLPSRNLERLEQLLDPGETRPRVRVSGQVFSYRGRDYLLLSEASSPTIDQPVAPGAAPPDTPDPGAPVRAEDLLRDLESRATPARALPRVMGRQISPDVTGTGAGLADGALITSRRGRLVRLPDGELAFTPDNDSTSPDGPMPLAPCLTLARMESVSLWRADGVPMEVSGRVLTYRGRRYLLPTMFIVRPPGDVTPLQ